MRIAVLANDVQKNILLSKKTNTNISFEFAYSKQEMLSYENMDAYFILNEEVNIAYLREMKDKPVFINSILSGLQNLPANVYGINTWPAFLKNETWEIATKNEDAVKKIFKILGWNYIIVPGEPGMISARIIAMIINEAYFALEDNISTKEEMDVAMRLGTNYPLGPFEWAKKIGLENIYNLLKILGTKDSRYIPSKLIEKELSLNI